MNELMEYAKTLGLRLEIKERWVSIFLGLDVRVPIYQGTFEEAGAFVAGVSVGKILANSNIPCPTPKPYTGDPIERIG